jgi:hypothetical protein
MKGLLLLSSWQRTGARMCTLQRRRIGRLHLRLRLIVHHQIMRWCLRMIRQSMLPRLMLMILMKLVRVLLLLGMWML